MTSIDTMSDTTEGDSSANFRRSPASPASRDGGSDTKSNSRSKAHIRVSLACVQCRSKHVKCDATLPACLRCQAEDKPCFYAKSRRGIRDPKKRSMITDRPPVTRPEHRPFSTASNSPPSVFKGDSPARVPPSWPTPSTVSILRQHNSEEDMMLNLFYTHFQPSHPCLPPKRFFTTYLETDPDAYHFLMLAIKFCGSVYEKQTATEDLKESAFTAACGPLPMTPQSVQGLLLLSIAAFGETLFEHHAGWLDRAFSMAIDIGMHRKAYAEANHDSVLAESFRRTWWILIIQQSTRSIGSYRSRREISDVDHDVDLPCEEWEYDSGIIPPPVSMSQYESRKNMSRTEFSSMAYLIDICKIQTELVVPYMGETEDKKAAMFERADSRICDWLRRVPQWKLDLVDPDGVVDLVIHHAMSLAHVNRLRLRQPALRSGLNLRDYFHFGPANGPHRMSRMVKGSGWKAQPVEVQAANGFCEIFRYTVPIKSLRPMIAPAMLVVALAYLDSCVFLGLDSHVLREKINMILHVLTVHGETWRLSQKVAEEIRFIAKEYLSNAGAEGGHHPGSTGGESWQALTTTTAPASLDNTMLYDPFFNLQMNCTGSDVLEGWEPTVSGGSWINV